MRQKKKHNKNSFVSDAKAIYGEMYEYDLSSFVNMTTLLEVNCVRHGLFLVTPSAHIGAKRISCPKCGNASGARKNIQNASKRFFISAKKKHGSRFIYDKAEYKGHSFKMKIKCRKHGYYLTYPKSHKKENGGCMECHKQSIRDRNSSLKKTTEGFIDDAKAIHGDRFDYSKTVYSGSDKYLFIICKKHGRKKVSGTYHLRLINGGCRECDYESRDYAPKEVRRLALRGRYSIINAYRRKGYNKNKNTFDILGIDWYGFKNHLEDNKYNFKVGDCDLDIDHIIPVSKAKTIDDVKRLNHYSNLQLLPSYYNRYIKRDNDFDVDDFNNWYKKEYINK